MPHPSDLVVKHPWWVILFFAAITGFFALQLPNLEIDPEVKNQLPPDMPERLNMNQVEERFGGSEMVMVVVQADDVLAPEVLTQVQTLSEALHELEAIEKVIDLFNLTEIRGEGGMMVVEPVISEIPETPEDVEALATRALGNAMVTGNVLSADRRATAVIGILAQGVEDGPTIAAVRDLIEAHEGPADVVLGGLPEVRTRVSEDIQGDMQKFVPIGLLVILVFLWACFRQVRGVLLPFSVVVMSTIVAMGLIPLFGWKVQMVTVVLPVILLAVANDYGIHLMAKYQEDNQPGSGMDGPKLARSVVGALGAPVIAAGITTMAGLLCLTTHIIVPAAQLGILASIGVLFALLGSLAFIPALLAVMPVAKPIEGLHDVTQANALDRGLNWTAHWVGRQPKRLILAVLVVTGVVATGIPRILVDTNPVNYYPAGSPVAETSGLINTYFGGTTELSVQVAGDVDDPEVLEAMDGLEGMLRAQDEVGFTSSIVSIIKSMNQAVMGGEEEHYALPDSREAVAQYHLLYSMGGDPTDFERIIDFEHEHTLLTARINSIGTQDIARVVEATKAHLEANPIGESSLVVGFGDVFVELVEAVVEGQITSLSLALLFVVILVAATFRSIPAGFYAVVPLILAVALLFGGMGWLGIELNVITAMLSSIMVGVGIDYTIHFLWRYRDERANGLDPEAAVVRTLLTAGRGIVFNALSVVVGFAVLLLSNFLPVMFFGFLVVVSISACLIGALVLLPAMVLVLRPAFLEPA